MLFGLLLMSCAGFFAFMQWGGALTGPNKNSQVLGDLNADKVRLLEILPPKPAQSTAVVPGAQVVIVSSPVAASAPLATEKPATVAASAPAPARASAALPGPVPVHMQGGKVVATKNCMEWGEFSGDDMALASKVLAGMKFGDKLTQRTVEYDKGYWVYVPPLRNKAAINKKIEEIRAAGIEEYFVVPGSGKWHNAISLGVFKTEEAAKHFQSSLKKKGLRALQV